MSFVAPYALLLIPPFAALYMLCRSPRFNVAAQLPGAWARVVAPAFRRIVGAQSQTRSAPQIMTFLAGCLLILALARPGVDLRPPEDFASLGGRVMVLDVGADLTRHRQFVSALQQVDPATATAVVAVAGDAYRVTPFTSDTTHIDRYMRVLSADMMPRPGHKPHLGLALAERLLEQGGFVVRQVVILSARTAPEETVIVPPVGVSRVFIDLLDEDSWRDWATAQTAEIVERDRIDAITGDFFAATWTAARAELPDAMLELKTPLIALAALLFLFKFRRRAE